MSWLIISFSLCTSTTDTPCNIDGCTVADDGLERIWKEAGTIATFVWGKPKKLSQDNHIKYLLNASLGNYHYTNLLRGRNCHRGHKGRWQVQLIFTDTVDSHQQNLMTWDLLHNIHHKIIMTFTASWYTPETEQLEK